LRYIKTNTLDTALPTNKEFDFAAGELLLVNKPYEWTSFDVVGKLRNSFKPLKLKVGHAGTLDPLATGLLIICTGKMTKQIDTFQAEEKEYTGTMILGATTPSYDMETAVEAKFDTSHYLTKRYKCLRTIYRRYSAISACAFGY
jgi:tRNA pseudouridine55 synthase